MGNDLKCARRFSMGKNNIFSLALRAVVVDCICLYFYRVGALKPAESLSTKMGFMIDWGTVKTEQGTPVRNSFASWDFKEKPFRCSQL